MARFTGKAGPHTNGWTSEQRAAYACAEAGTEDNPNHWPIVYVEVATREGYTMVMLPPDEAESLALEIIRCAEKARADSDTLRKADYMARFAA